MEERLGCDRCFPASAEEAWVARGGLAHAAELVDESHYHVMLLACEACGQRFISIFTETIDWADGDDPQYWQLQPVTGEEAETLKGSGASIDAAIRALAGRRSLCVNSPKGGPKKIFWSRGVTVMFHD